MDILSLAGTLLLAAAQPQSQPQPAPVAEISQQAPTQRAGHVKVFSGKDGTLSISKTGDTPDATAGKANEERPMDLTDAPPADPTALLIPAIQKVREAVRR